MARGNQRSDKREALRRHSSWNPRADQVQDPLFEDSEFFDAEDLVQVKYEMLRRVRVDGEPARRVAAGFGFARQTFYLAKERFEQEGLSGLVPHKPGPRGAHKLTDEVMEFLDELCSAEALSPVALAERVQERFGITVHARSIERALKRWRKKNSRESGRKPGQTRG